MCNLISKLLCGDFSNRDAEKLHYEIARNLTRFCAYDTFCKIRSSIGIDVDKIYLDSGVLNKNEI